MTVYGPLFEQFGEKQASDPFALQNSKLLTVTTAYGPVWARAGSMVAYQGDVRFANRGSGGLNRLVKAAVTGEGVDLMQVAGQGEVFLADQAANVQVLYLENDQVSVNGRNVLAFSDSVGWDIRRIRARSGMMAGGLYNVVLHGTGYVAVTTDGDPVALDVASAPTFADPQAVVLWTAGVEMDVRVDTGGLRSMVRGGSGETIQMAFRGRGHVVVQPSEGRPLFGGDEGAGGRGGGLLGIFEG